MSEEIKNEFDLSKYKDFDKLLGKKFGNKVYTGFGKAEEFERVEKIPLKCISLNNILGGGLPSGRIIELLGEPSSGKSLICNHIVSSFQSLGKMCLWIDVERALDPDFMGYCGVDLNKLAKVVPNSAEEAFEVMRTAMLAKDEEGNPILSLVVLDSVAGLFTSDEYEKDMGQAQVGKLARFLSQSLKQITTIAAENNITVCLINQLRATNLMGYGPSKGGTGGNAIPYYASVRLMVKRAGYIEEKKEKTGHTMSIETVKNKTAPPFKKCEVNAVYPTVRNGEVFAGLDVFSDVIHLAIDNDLIKQGGAWFTLPNGEKANGLTKLYKHYQDHQEQFDELYNEVVELNNSNGK